MASFKEYQMLFQLNASVGSGFNSTFSSGQSAIQSLQNKINDLNKTQSDISSYTKQQSAIEKTNAKLELYRTQLANLQSATASTAKEEAELKNAIAAKEAQIDSTTEKLDKQNAALSETGQALREAGVDTGNLAAESERLKAEAQEVAQAQLEEAEAAEQAGQSLKEAMTGAAAALTELGIVEGLKQVYGALADCSQAAAEFETAMAGVKRTVGGSDSFIDNLGDTFLELSTQIPITASELAGIATTAGQLGIAQDSVESFTTVMAQLATTTDLSAENAATMLAQFSNITGVTEYDRLGSTVAALGDATATTASKVVEMSQGMAASASIAGMSSTDILAISAAVGSLGIEAASGSTAMSTLISTLYKATETGDKLDEFASVAGMSAEEFKTAWGTDAVGALNSFIQGLNDTERNGRSAVVILDELGIKNVRQTKTILGLASAGDLLNNTVTQANAAWSQNTALSEKAGIMYGTTEAKLTMLQNAANNVQVAIGDALNPAISSTADAITGLLGPLAEWIADNPAVVQGITAFVGTLGVATAGIVGYTAVTKLAAAASALFSASIPGLGVILAVAAGIGLLTAGISALIGANEDATASFEDLNDEYDDMVSQVKKQTEIIELVDTYKQLNDETQNLQRLMSGDFTTEIKFTATGPKESEKLTAENFVSDTEVSLTAIQVSNLLAEGFLSPNDNGIQITAGQVASLLTKGFLSKDDPGITLEAGQMANLLEEGFLKPNDPGIILTAGQVRDLTERGFLDPEDPGIILTAQQKKTLKSLDFMADDDEAITLTAQQTADLYEAGFFAFDDPGITVSAEQTATLLREGFIDERDPGITLTAEQTATLTSMGFLEEGDNGVVQLKASTIDKIQASDFMANQTVTITAENGNTLTAEDFGISDQTLTYIATMQPESYAEVQQKAKSLAAEIASVDSQLGTAKTTLAQAQTQAAALEEAINGTKNKKKKSVLQERLEEVNGTITEQTELIDSLEGKQALLEKEYGQVSTAAAELQGQEEALTAVKRALAGASDQVTEASLENAGAFDQEAEAAARDAEAQLARLRSQLYQNAGSQLKIYTQAVNDASEAEEKYEGVSQKAALAQKYAGMGIDDINYAYQRLLNTLDDMEAAEGWSPDDEDYKAAVAEAEAFISLMSGSEVSGLQEDANRFSDGTIAWADSFGYLSVNGKRWNLTMEDINAQVAEYKDQIDSAEKTQSDFIDNIADAINAGMEETEIRAMLTNALEGEADAEDTVNAIMEDAKSRAEELTAAKEDLTEATEESSEATDEEASNLDTIIAKMQALKDSYDETYKSALESMNGQFDLFEHVNFTNNGHKGGISDMTKSLEEQEKYIEEYTQNYQNASTAFEQAGVDSETANAILSSLSDGSTESAEYLKTLATATDEELTQLASQYSSLGESKEEYASTVAEIQTDFSSTMTELASELEETVAKMDFSTDAATNAATSMAAFVAEIRSYKDEAAKAAAEVAAAAAAKLKIGTDGDGDGGEGGVDGYASGTTSAAKGLALVGEEGPELMYMNGGEQIVNAQTTSQLLDRSLDAEPLTAASGNGYSRDGNMITIDFSPVYNVSGGANADEVRSVLEEQSENLREQIEDILTDIDEDTYRRSLA